MNWLDVVIVAAILGFAVAGLSSGLLREGVTALAAAIGVVLAGRYYARLADDIRIFYDDQTTDNLIAFAAIFTAAVLGGRIAGNMLRGVAHMLLLGWLDQAGGLLFGLLEGCIVVELVLIGFAVFPAADWAVQAIDHSLLAPVFLSGVPWLLHILPDLFRRGLRAS